MNNKRGNNHGKNKDFKSTSECLVTERLLIHVCGVSNAKTAINTSLSCPVPQFFGDPKTLFVVVYVFFRINLTHLSTCNNVAYFFNLSQLYV